MIASWEAFFARGSVMDNNIFIGVFLVLATIGFYFDMVQRTTVLICRTSDIHASIGGFLNPRFIKLAFPLDLFRWGWVLYWAWTGSTTQALVAAFISFIVSILLPVPASLTLPPIFKQIQRVRELDPDLGEALTEAARKWEIHGGRR